MKLPDRVNAGWIDTLEDAQLLKAEAQLHAEFAALEGAEKKRAGDRYSMMRGPEPLMNAWVRWLLVSNAARARGVVVHRKTKS